MMMIMRLRIFKTGIRIVDRPANYEKRISYSTSSSSPESGSSLSYVSNPGKRELVNKTIGKLFEESVERFKNRDCLVSVRENTRITFGDALKRADRVAAGFKKLGLKRGDRVGIWGPNTAEWYISFMAMNRAGFKIVGINPADQLADIEYAVDKVGVRAVVAHQGFKTQNYPEILLKVKSKSKTLEHIVIFSDNHITGCRRFSDVESSPSLVEVEAIAAEQAEIDPKSGATIQFTSGTTGRPKAAQVAHMSYVNNSRQGSERLELGEGEHTICLNVPFFHAFGLAMGMTASLHSGSTIVLPDLSFNPRQSIDAIVKEKCTVIYGTPTMWVDLVNVQQEIKAPIGQIFNGLTGGSPATPNLLKKTRETFGFDNLKSIYGLTEATCISFQTMPNTPRDILEISVGQLSDHTEVQVVDENGNRVPFGTPGELWIRGYHTMIGYWGDEENTRKTITEDGWLKSGDQFILRPDGYGQVIGRLKDMLIRGGENIFPREIEDFLETHPGVIEAHVFGVYDERMGEEICACIRLRNGVKFSSDELKAYGRGKIAHYKIPRYIIFRNEFPKTTSGKVKKNLLRTEIENQGIVPKKPDDN